MKRYIILIALLIAVPIYSQVGLRGDGLRSKNTYQELSINSGGWIGTSQAYGWTFTSNPYIYTSENVKVGIGLSAPGYLLDVGTTTYGNDLAIGALNATTDLGMRVMRQWSNVAGNVVGGIRLGEGQSGIFGVDEGGSGAQGVGLFAGTTASTIIGLYMDETGKIGIGTTSPAQQLEIRNDQNALTRLRVTNDNAGTAAQAGIEVFANSGSGYISMYDDGFSTAFLRDAMLIATNTTAADVILATGNSSGDIRFLINGITEADQAMIINTDKNVGIGTSSPEHPLHVRGATTMLKHSGAGTAMVVNRVDGKMAALQAGDNGARFLFDETGYFEIKATDSTDIKSATGTGIVRMHIATNGNVGIGTASPDSQLTVANGAHIGRDLKVDGTITGQTEYDDIQVTFESPASSAADTLWFWENAKHVAVTIDSITAYSDVDDTEFTIAYRNRSGGAPVAVDNITTSNNGTDVYYAYETVISTSTIPRKVELGIIMNSPPAPTWLRIVIYYHYTKTAPTADGGAT